MANITRNSHYVPQSVLRRWSVDGNRVWAHRLLVSHPSVPEWECRSIRSLACQPDLYTMFSGGQEEDEFETFITREFEEPGNEAIENLLSRTRMVPADWHRIARFVALQQLRTPLHFIESIQRWKKQIPEALEEVIRQYEAQAEHASFSDQAPAETASNYLRETLRVTIEQPAKAGGQTAIRAEIKSARSLWMATLRHLLTNRADVICQHRWRTAEPAGDEEWPLTDHPVLNLNFDGPEKYDFGGGWGHPGSEFIMPISPRVAVYTQVGVKARGRFTFTTEQTHTLQRLMTQRAFRWILARQPVSWIASEQPRLVDNDKFVTEQAAWRRWNPEQSDDEARFPPQA